MARKPKRAPGRKAPVSGDAWADKFYHPMPVLDWSQDDSVITDDPPVDRMQVCAVEHGTGPLVEISTNQAAWDALPEWAREYALSEQERTKGGKPPICPGCGQHVPTYPFNAVESYRGVRHTWCRYPEQEAASA